MTKKLVIFGLEDAAQLAYFYFTKDTSYEVCAFTVDTPFIKEEYFMGLPVVDFESISTSFPPQNYDCFVAIGYTNTNELRKSKYLEVKSKGYHTPSYVSSLAITTNNFIGNNSFILEGVIVQPFVTLGDNITLWSGCHIGHHSVIEDHVFIAPKAALSGYVHVGSQSFIGINATIRDQIKIGTHCVIGAGTLLMSDVPDYSVCIGEKTQPTSFRSSELKNI